jgi:histidine triad (HIT) family protein
MSDCVFCKIVSGDLNSAKVYEDEVCIAFLDVSPVNKGHTLVVSKDHYETIMDTPDDTLSHLISVVKRVANAMGSEGITIGQNNKSAGGQIVPHIHFHVMPRFINDGHVHNWEKGSYADDDERESYRKKIASNIE